MPSPRRSPRNPHPVDWAGGPFERADGAGAQKPSTPPQSPARKKAAQKRKPVADSQDTGVVVAPDPLRERLASLRKEHDRLMRDIAKKRAQLTAAEDLLREVTSALAARAEPIRERVLRHIDGIKEAFAELLSPKSRLTRRDKTKVRRVYLELAEALGFEVGRDEGQLSPQDNFDEEWFSDEPRHAHRSSGKANGGGGYSAEKPSEANASTLRSLFRRLAIALHPDKVQDEATKAERTTVMKDVTRAYESGDLARLMELERSFLARVPVAEDDDSVKRRCEQMLAANTELRRQLRTLTSELKLVHFGQPIQFNPKAANAREQAFAEIASTVQTFEKEEERIAVLHDFVRSFAEGRMTLVDFLAGPAVPEPDLAEFEELVFEEDELFAEVLEELFRQDARRPTKRKTRRRQSR